LVPLRGSFQNFQQTAPPYLYGSPPGREGALLLAQTVSSLKGDDNSSAYIKLACFGPAVYILAVRSTNVNVNNVIVFYTLPDFACISIVRNSKRKPGRQKLTLCISVKVMVPMRS